MLFALFLVACRAWATSSIDELKAKAEAGDGQAQWELGFAYCDGRHGVTQDKLTGSAWLKRATDSFRKLAEQGDAKAQSRLGYAYTMGFGVLQDDEQALKWTKLAAEQDNISAIRNLISMYSEGRGGVTKDSVEVIKLKSRLPGLYRKAAEQGDGDAMNYLSEIYTYGRGVAIDKAEGLKWLRLAGEHDYLAAQKALGKIYLTGDNVPQDRGESVKWFRKAANHYLVDAKLGDAQAQWQYGCLMDSIANARTNYSDRDKNSAELREAAFWFIKAAYQGYAPAQTSISYAYYLGEGVAQSDVEGMAWEIVSIPGRKASFEDEETLMDELRRNELQMGPEKTKLAQERSREILKEVKTSNSRLNGAEPSSLTTASNNDTPKSSGTGTIVSAHGHILTAAHVVAGASKIVILTVNGTWNATILGIDEPNDVAVLKIDGGPFSPIPIAASRRVRLGQIVATIGFPNIEIQGYSPKVTRGEISSINGAADDPRSWQISVPVQPGNSGGPLLDENGNLIGIVVSKLGLKAAEATGDMPQNVSYAIKSAYVLPLLEPYLDSNTPEPNQQNAKQSFADMISVTQQSIVLILVY